MPGLHAEENILNTDSVSGGPLSFKILNLNTMLIPFEFVAPAYRKRADELENFIAKKYGIVLLQEVFSKKIQSDFISRWYKENNLEISEKENGSTSLFSLTGLSSYSPNDVKIKYETGSYFVSDPKRQDHRALFGSGLLLLSKYPIISSEAFCYKDRSGTDVFAGKGVIYAKIKTGSGENDYVHFFTTHMQSHSYIQTRQKNAEELFNFVFNIISEENSLKGFINPVVITGDFNVPANSLNNEISPEYVFLTEYISRICDKINANLKEGSFYLNDLWLQEHPDNIGYTWIAKNEDAIKGSPYGEIGNTIAVEKQGAERIDYIFYFEGSNKSFKIESHSIDLFPKDAEKIYSFKNGKLKSHTLSDHLGLDAQFLILNE